MLSKLSTANGSPVVLTFADLPKPASQSAAEVQAFQAVRQGKVALAALSLRPLQRFSSLYAFDSIPFFVGSALPDLLSMLSGAWPFLEKRLAEDGLTLLGVMFADPVAIVLDPPGTGPLSQYVASASTGVERRAAKLIGLRSAAEAAKTGQPRAHFKSVREMTAATYPAWRPLVVIVAHAPTFERLTADQKSSVMRARPDHLTPLGMGPLRDEATIDPLVREILAAAGERMADEWAIATGADGVAIVKHYRETHRKR